MSTPITLVSTVFNEAARIDQTIRDLDNQTVKPSEIIITDAGSTDGTYEKLLAWKSTSTVPIVVLQRAKCNVAEGRNLAIRASKYSLIASTDFGCRFHPDWLKAITDPFQDPSVNVVSGTFTVQEEAQTTLAAKAAYIFSNGYKQEVAAPWFVPSSRSIAYRKEVYNEVGGYCEWLTLAADDFIFGKEILAKGYTFYPVDKPYVYWIRHAAASGFIKEAGRYGLGDGEAKVNMRNFISNLIEICIRYLLFLNVLLLVALFFATGIKTGLFLLTVLFLPGLRSYVHYSKAWLKFRSSKYNFRTFCYGFYLLEKTRQKYITEYIKGCFFSTPHQMKEAKYLKARLSKA